MSGGQAPAREPLKERIFLYGIRQLLLVVVILAVGAYVAISGVVYGAVENIVGGMLIVFIGAGLAYGFKTTAVRRITKRYYNVSTMVGREGTAKSTFDAGTKGVVNVENEYWSAVSSGRIVEGETVTVESVEADRITLRVRKK